MTEQHEMVCSRAAWAANCSSAKGQNCMNIMVSAGSVLSNPASGVTCLLRQL